jgi:hypothetical protein
MNETKAMARRQPPRKIAAERTFKQLARHWREETKVVSSITAKSIHPSYQSIMAMGPIVIPFIFRELKREPDDWFWALRYLCNTDPVAPEDAGDIQRMTKSWLRWAVRHNYL